MSWENWINNNDNHNTCIETEPVIPSNGPIHATIEEIETHIQQRSNLLNTQLRGPINSKGREENLQLIYLTMSSIFEDGYKLGLKDGKTNGIKEEVEERRK